MKLIAGIRKLLGTPERIAIVWLIAGVLLLAWVVLQDAFYIRNPIGYYYMLGFPLLLALQHLLASALRMFAEKTSQGRRVILPKCQRLPGAVGIGPGGRRVRFNHSHRPGQCPGLHREGEDLRPEGRA